MADRSLGRPSQPLLQPQFPIDPPGVQMTFRKSEQRSHGRYILNGHYVREKQVGRGQHGQVFKAVDIAKNNRPVAIKVVKRNNPRANRMRELRRQQTNIPTTDHTPLTAKLSSTETKIRKEIAIMKKCRHANVVMLLEVIDDPICERIFMVMEYLGGGELKWKTRDVVPKPILRVEQIRRICRDVILGLEYLHFQGIIHRDIKPANLVWNDDRSTVKITDFGVSHFSYAQRLAAGAKLQLLLEKEDPILLDDSDLAKRAGTPFYLAPEVVDTDWLDLGPADQPRPRQPITKAIDIWAFGITLYSLLFGGPPFFEDDPQPHAEFRVYKKICMEDWGVPATMGFDAIPTGGRHPTKRNKEGYQVIKLLDALLEKNPTKRITLQQLKSDRWILAGIPDPDRWIRDTTPQDADAISITERDTSSALAPLASGTWGRIQRRFSSVFRKVATAGRAPWTRGQLDEEEEGSPSGTHSTPPDVSSTATAKSKSGSSNVTVKRHHSSSGTSSWRRDKGKRPNSASASATNTTAIADPPTSDAHRQRRAKSTERSGGLGMQRQRLSPTPPTPSEPMPMTRSFLRGSRGGGGSSSSAGAGGDFDGTRRTPTLTASSLPTTMLMGGASLASSSSTTTTPPEPLLTPTPSSQEAQRLNWFFGPVRRWTGNTALSRRAGSASPSPAVATPATATAVVTPTTPSGTGTARAPTASGLSATASLSSALSTSSPAVVLAHHPPIASPATKETASTMAAPSRNRHSEEALCSSRTAPPPSDPLTNAKRASSWGSPPPSSAGAGAVGGAAAGRSGSGSGVRGRGSGVAVGIGELMGVGAGRAAGAGDDGDDESWHSDTLGEVEMRIGAGGFADPPSVATKAIAAAMGVPINSVSGIDIGAGAGAGASASAGDNASGLTQLLMPSSAFTHDHPHATSGSQQQQHPNLLHQVVMSGGEEDEDDADDEDGEEEHGDVPCSWTQDTSSEEEEDGDNLGDVYDAGDGDDDAYDDDHILLVRQPRPFPHYD